MSFTSAPTLIRNTVKATVSVTIYDYMCYILRVTIRRVTIYWIFAFRFNSCRQLSAARIR